MTENTAPNAEDLMKAAKELQPVLAKNVTYVEEERRLPDETVEELHKSGLFRAIMPQRWGGSALTLFEELQIAAEMGKTCPSTAWAYTLLADVTAFPVQFLGDEGEKEVYTDDRTLVCGVISNGGTATPVDGGYRVSGSWGFASGCLHADWMSGLVTAYDVNGAGAPAMAFFPLSEAAIKDTWFVTGMKGTGSNTVVADDIFIPASRMGMLADRFALEGQVRPGAAPCERWALMPYVSIGLLGATLGAVQGALDYVAEKMHTRGVTYFDFERQVDSGVLLHNIALAEMHLASAWLHVRDACWYLDEFTKSEPLDYVTRARLRAQGGFACEELRTAMGLLVTIGGASSFADNNPLQRFWRDVNVGTRHSFDNTPGCLEAYGRAKAGVENITQLI